MITRLAVVLLSLAAWAPWAARAQDTPPTSAPTAAPASDETEPDAASERATTFRAVSGGTTEDVPGGPLVLAAYFGILLLLFVFLFRQGRLIAAAHRELSELRKEALNRSE